MILSKNARRSLVEWNPQSDRILLARFRTPARNICIVQCYAPTEVADMERKENFYEEFNRTLMKIHRGGTIMLMGDFNAKVGDKNEGCERIMGKHGMGTKNINGELFLELCLEHDIVIGGTIFPHKDIHKITWVSPDLQTQNQIDHIA